MLLFTNVGFYVVYYFTCLNLRLYDNAEYMSNGWNFILYSIQYFCPSGCNKISYLILSYLYHHFLWKE